MRGKFHPSLAQKSRKKQIDQYLYKSGIFDLFSAFYNSHWKKLHINYTEIYA